MRTQTKHRGTGWTARAWRSLALALCLTTCAAPLVAFAQRHGAALDDIEAAYIVKFANYVDWPAHAFTSATAPMVVGVMDDPALARALDRSVRGKQAQGRTLQVRYLKPGERLRGVHVLVLPRADDPTLARVMQDAAGQPILTISTPARGPASSRYPAVIHLVMEDKRLRFDVNLPPQRQGMQVSALMLTAARRVVRSPE